MTWDKDSMWENEGGGCALGTWGSAVTGIGSSYAAHEVRERQKGWLTGLGSESDDAVVTRLVMGTWSDRSEDCERHL